MQKNTEKLIKIRLILAAAGIASAVLLYLLLLPRYRDYIAADNKETCAKLDWSTYYWYIAHVAEAEEAGQTPDYEGILRNYIHDHFRVEIEAVPEQEGVYTADGLCRAGGTTVFSIEPENHHIHTSCTLHGDQFAEY